MSGDGAATFFVGAIHLSLALPKVYLLSVLIDERMSGFDPIMDRLTKMSDQGITEAEKIFGLKVKYQECIIKFKAF